MPMESRLLLAFILMGAVLFLTQYFFSPTPPQKSAVKQTQPASPKQAVKPSEPAAPPQAEPAQQLAASRDETHTIETEVYRVVFANRGAVVRHWILKKYKDSGGKPLDLVNSNASSKIGFPFSTIFTDQKPPRDLNQSLYVATPSGDGLGIDFAFSNGNVTSRKSFRFQKNSYLVDFSSQVQQDNRNIPHFLAWRGGFGDPQVLNAPAAQHSLYYDTNARKLVIKDMKAAKDGVLTDQGNFAFAGLQDAFFAAVFLPKQRESVQIQTWSDETPLASDKEKQERHVGAAVGGSGYNQFALFVGPKDLDLLRRVNPALEQLVDFGFFGFIARPLFLSLNWFNDKYVHNYGWSIIIVTIIINLALLPLKLSSMKSMKKMQALAPQVNAINDKYKHLSIRDPKKAEANQEIMELYKKNNVNPMGGCVPLLLQIPFFIAFYTVLTVAIEMRGANWLWVTDLSQPETLPIHILPLLMVATQFWLQKMTPATSMDPAQQRVMLFMPLMFAFFFYNASAGLVLYWLTGNVVGILQQWFINKTGDTPAVEVIPPASKKKPSRN
jgi:YidC/Oxa1 family membrane protein insertase